MQTVWLATWEMFWIELKEFFLFPFYHPFYPDDNERMENYWPCSDEPQFFAPMYIIEDEALEQLNVLNKQIGELLKEIKAALDIK